MEQNGANGIKLLNVTNGILNGTITKWNKWNKITKWSKWNGILNGTITKWNKMEQNGTNGIKNKSVNPLFPLPAGPVIHLESM